MAGHGHRYRWEGHIVYAARVGDKWRAAYDGPCGRERSYLALAELSPCETKEEMRTKLDAWAAALGLESDRN